MRGLRPFLCFVATSLAVVPAALALNATEIFAKARGAIYLVIVSGDEAGGVDVASQGSAVLIAPGRFVTSCHVLDHGKKIVVSRREDKVIERVVLVSVARGTDLCELDLAEPKPGFEAAVEIAPADSLQVGATVYAIGSPRGMELTISNGIVSGFREGNGGMKLVQTTAPISPGSSGGGLFDDQGRLVGITAMMAKNAQNLNFAIPAQYIPSARITAAELQKQRSAGARAEIIAAQESAFERQERLRRQEQDAMAARKKQLDEALAPREAVTPAAASANARSAASPRPLAARLALYEKSESATTPGRVYEQLSKRGELAGLDDNAVILKVYEVMIREQVANEVKWNEGGGYVAEFEVQLRRSGDVMYVIPVKRSGFDRFDREAQRAIGAASPLPVPQDNDVFEQMSAISIPVRASGRAARPASPDAPARKKAKQP